MSWEYLHLVTHSFPIVLCVSASLVGLIGWIRDDERLEMWSLLALLIAGAFVVPAYFTGLAAADVVQDRMFVRPGIVQTHRFAATWAAVPVFTAGALAAFSIKERDDRRLRHFVIAVSLIASGAIGVAAWLGSRIEHGEQPEASADRAATPPAAWTADGREGECEGSDRSPPSCLPSRSAA